MNLISKYKLSLAIIAVAAVGTVVALSYINKPLSAEQQVQVPAKAKPVRDYTSQLISLTKQLPDSKDKPGLTKQAVALATNRKKALLELFDTHPDRAALEVSPLAGVFGTAFNKPELFEEQFSGGETEFTLSVVHGELFSDKDGEEPTNSFFRFTTKDEDDKELQLHFTDGRPDFESGDKIKINQATKLDSHLLLSLGKDITIVSHTHAGGN